MPRKSDAHRARMTERRQNQLARVSGFVPIVRRRTIKRVEALLEEGVSEALAPAIAMRELAASLSPAASFCRTHRAPRPSKSDSAAYRRGGQCAAAIA